MSDPAVSIILRRAVTDDEALIYATWLKGLYHGNEWFRQIQQDRFYQVYHKVIEGILARPSAQIQVACFEDRPDVIVGYSVSDNGKLHWVYVKPTWRKLGIAKRLIPSLTTSCTHLTKMATALKPKAWDFDPFF